MRSPEQIGKDTVLAFLKSKEKVRVVEYYNKITGQKEVWFPELADAIAQAIQAERDAAQKLVEALVFYSTASFIPINSQWGKTKVSMGRSWNDAAIEALAAYKTAIGEGECISGETSARNCPVHQ